METEVFYELVNSEHYKAKNTIKNIRRFSVSGCLFEAFNEWEVSWDHSPYYEEYTFNGFCEFCGTPIVKCFEVTNRITGKSKLIGGICVHKYSKNLLGGRTLTVEEAKSLQMKAVRDGKERSAKARLLLRCWGNRNKWKELMLNWKEIYGREYVIHIRDIAVKMRNAETDLKVDRSEGELRDI